MRGRSCCGTTRSTCGGSPASAPTATPRTPWSKPALPFWLMALSMKLLGVGLGAAPDEMVRAPWPELAIRLPSMLTGLGCAVFLGWACARLLAAARPADPGQPVRAGFTPPSPSSPCRSGRSSAARR
ncbi:hypothetical protein [Nannocystis pusilla]|uniref:hypothetical protein n=1 Tax=Nannocystis pusilla TaxID=889268 RepID=UPI003B7806EF